MPEEKNDPNRPVQAQSELKKMQQRLVDETVDESFPASDPPAWTTTGSKSVAAKSDARAGESEPQGGAGGAAKESDGGLKASVHGLAEQATHLAQGARRTGERYLEEARRHWPEVERYYEEGRRAVAKPVEAYPLAAIILAALVGYGLGWLVSARSRAGHSPGRNFPAYGRRPQRETPGRFTPEDRMRAQRNFRTAGSEASASRSAPSSY
jgi:ElaB/YqjD/DUF883 family membrane-anchored ribosome-binding protein